MKALFLVLIAAVLTNCSPRKAVTSGIPLELAVARKNAIRDVAYDLRFNLPSDRADSIAGEVTIQFTWKDKPIELQLDYQPDETSIHYLGVNGKQQEVFYENEHIILEAGLLTASTNSITIRFTAGEAALNRNKDYLYTLFVPSRASTCFPLFDQPDLKATFRLELTMPSAWSALSNGKQESTTTEGDRKTIRFGATRPTSPYQFAFTAGNFRSATDPVSGMTMLYRETDSVKVSRNLPKIFELHRQSLEWLTGYTGIAYPYDKFDFALMPAFQFGGMEHPGAIFYRESSLFLEPSASINEELRRASLIAHETAHMWFGNLVTMQWFNDVWLKEVFANFMAAKMVSPSFPTVNHDLRFLMAHYPSAYEIDRSHGAHPIQQPLDNLRNAGSVYGAIIYQKAPIMMRNLETWMGADNFQKGLRDYLQAYSYGNATWDDLVGHLEKYAKEDLQLWNQAWIKTAGMPEIDVTRDPDGKFFLQVTNDSLQTIWPQSLRYRIRAKYIDAIQPVTFRTSSRALLSKWVEPGMQVIPNYDGRGYGYFRSDQEVLRNAWRAEKDAVVRASVWMTLWETFLREPASANVFSQEVLLAVIAEKDPLLLEYLADKLDRVFWQFLPAADRSFMSKEIEDKLLERLILEKDNSNKRALFNLFRAIATSPDGVNTLKRLWMGEITLGLELTERDRIQLTYALALRQVEGFEKILDDQLARITNPDRKAEFTFVRSALSADPIVRDGFFASLKEKQNRAREPWVLEAVRYLHHPLRSESSERYLAESLELLEEIQRTGDIFFPKGWLDATLGYYQSPGAAKAVRAYLTRNKGLRQDLRNKLLQSSDMLFRAAQRQEELASTRSR
jgi:aminopeptidase N